MVRFRFSSATDYGNSDKDLVLINQVVMMKSQRRNKTNVI